MSKKRRMSDYSVGPSYYFKRVRGSTTQVGRIRRIGNYLIVGMVMQFGVNIAEYIDDGLVFVVDAMGSLLGIDPEFEGITPNVSSDKNTENDETSRYIAETQKLTLEDVQREVIKILSDLEFNNSKEFTSPSDDINQQDWIVGAEDDKAVRAPYDDLNARLDKLSEDIDSVTKNLENLTLKLEGERYSSPRPATRNFVSTRAKALEVFKSKGWRVS